MNRYGKDGIPFFFLIDFDEIRCIIEKPENLSEGEILFSYPFAGNVSCTDMKSDRKPVWNTCPQTYEEYLHSFDIVYKNIYKGNSFLTNLTCATPIETDMTLEDIQRQNSNFCSEISL